MVREPLLLLLLPEGCTLGQVLTLTTCPAMRSERGTGGAVSDAGACGDAAVTTRAAGGDTAPEPVPTLAHTSATGFPPGCQPVEARCFGWRQPCVREVPYLPPGCTQPFHRTAGWRSSTAVAMPCRPALRSVGCLEPCLLSTSGEAGTHSWCSPVGAPQGGAPASAAATAPPQQQQCSAGAPAAVLLPPRLPAVHLPGMLRSQAHARPLHMSSAQ